MVTTVLLDAACRMQLQVLAAGGATHRSSDAEALIKREHCYPAELIQHAWNYMVRQVDSDGHAPRT